MSVLYTNNATTTLSASITNSTTSLSVASGTGSLFPAITGSDFFFVTISNSAGTNEIVKVTARSVDTFTIVRAQDGTSAAAWSAGDKVELRITKAMLDQFKTDAIAAYTASDVLAKLLTVDGAGSGLDADTLGGYYLSQTIPYHSGSDFVNGTLVITSIPAAATNGASFVIEVTGKGYGENVINLMAEGYLYDNTIINYDAIDIGGGFSTNLYMIENGGYLCFWWARMSYWQSFSVKVRDAKGSSANTVTNITDVALPAYTKGVIVTPRKVLNSSNYNSYAPSLTGTGASGTWGISISGNAATAGNADTLDGQHGSYYQPASSAITTSNIGSQSVNYATSAGTAGNGGVTSVNGMTGAVTLSTGGVTSLNGQTGAITNTTLYAIGSYISGRPENTTNYGVNSTVAGSSLYSCSIPGTYTASYDYEYQRWSYYWQNDGRNLTNVGSWRCVSAAIVSSGTSFNTGYAGLWVRYA